MFSLWLIIGIAAASAISLTVSGVLLAVHLERRRNRRWLKENNIDRSRSNHHRPHLSITDVDFDSLPQQMHSSRQAYERPRSGSSRFYASSSSQEDIKSFPQDVFTDPMVNPGHVSAENSFQWLNPSKKSRRKKKVPKLTVSGPPTMNRLSAVIEMSDELRQTTPEPVELPAHRTPRVTPEKEVNVFAKEHGIAESKVHNHQTSVTTIIAVPTEPTHNSNNRAQYEAIGRSRSISAGSIVTPPPSFPLPELPAHPRVESLRTKSQLRSQSSDVGRYYGDLSATPSASVQTQVNQLNRTSGFSRFEFGLFSGDGSPVKYKAYVPSLQIDTKSASSSHWPIQSELLRPKSSGNNTPSGEFEIIDASSWNIPRGLKHLVPASPVWEQRYSSAIYMQSTSDPRKSLTAPNSTSSSPLRFTDDSSRPPSVTSLDMFRFSVVGSPLSEAARKGHKRQNCVRIKNLQPIEPRKRPSSQLGRLTEMEEDSSILLPSPPKRIIDGQPKEGKGSIRPIDKSPPMSLRIKRPGLAASRNVSEQSMRGVGQSASTTVNTQDVGQLEQPEAIPEQAIRPLQLAKKDFETDLSKQTAEFSLASQSFFLDAESPQRHKSKVQGPRSIPAASLRVRNQTGSPIRRKSSNGRRTTREANPRRANTSRNNTQPPTMGDVPEVILVHSSPTTSVHIPASPNRKDPDAERRRKRSKTVAGHHGEISSVETRSRQGSETRTRAQLLGTPPTKNRPHHSPSAISIWEDVSVCADSPDTDRRFRHSQSSSRPVSMHQASPSKSKQASELIAKYEGIENAHKRAREPLSIEDDDLRLRILREGNQKRSQTTSASIRLYEGIGLGLRLE